MIPDLLSANVSMVFMAIVAATLLVHLARIAGPDRWLHAAYAATAVGLFYLFGSAAFGWSFVPREALFALYALLFAAVVALALMRRNATGGAGAPVAPLLIQYAGMAYMWAPVNYWKPPLAALFLLYFIVEAAGWIRGRQPAPAADEETRRPPLIPPKPIRGLSEVALASVAAAMVYVFAAGMGKAPVAATPPAEEASAAPAETAASDPDAAAQAASAGSETAPVETAAKEPEASPAEPAAENAAPPARTYTALAGDTLKSIAKKLYGKPEKWRAVASANPGLKPGARLKAGQVVALPEAPANR